MSFLNLNVQDDRKTHKRDIEQKNRTEDEVVATVVEVIATGASETTTETTIPTTNEPIVDSTTEPTNTNAPETMETTTQPISTEAAPTAAAAASSTTQTTSASISVVDPGFQPILDFYYGGTPNENANFIYLTTSQPELVPTTQKPNTANDRSDTNAFKPSIQYEYRNYRYDTDSHFVPIVGAKQVF